ncbi:peptidoglycan-binding protein LysM [Paenibacillus sp. RC67]|uniref:LysM peptidoglycan-binding domain-containing protein n=1 Tax=Paenibacillus sp. RC67 TaxID=3039392 RepID=UPI0024AE09B6|nr:peptidoglycan-binding protein LysM [Paenibacillus sp. RC67]
MNNYRIMLSWNNEAEGFQIPVNPESLDVKEESQGKTYNIVGKGGGTSETRAGEINVIKSPKLKEVGFSSFFPNQYYPFVNEEVPLFVPMYYINLIRKWMESQRPIRFIVAGDYNALTKASGIDGISDLNFPASIESFEWKEVAGSSGDIEYSLKLKEYVFYSARSVSTTVSDNGETVLVQQARVRPDERVRPETYTLHTGEKLRDVAKRLFGNAGRWREIQSLNGITEDKLKDLTAGTFLRIPQN